LQSLTGDERKDATLIGQFGIGFYSAFIVAERVVLTTRRNGLASSEGVRWESDGKGEYTLETMERTDRGTTILLQLREGEDDLLNGYRLRSIIKKYSDHISVPILMPAEPGDEAGDEQGESQAASEATVNRASALWTRPRSEFTDHDYKSFYQHIANDFSDPLTWIHSRIEGTYEYTLLLFIPSRAPYDLWVRESRSGVRLHVNRVFILEDTGNLLPTYLRFVRGVIDSSDLPLNVSREILQGSRAVDNIRSTAVKRLLKCLAEMAETEPEKYATFWKELGVTLKEGVADDYANRNEIAKLLLFPSTKSGTDDSLVSLNDYIARMKEGRMSAYFGCSSDGAASCVAPGEAQRNADSSHDFLP
jgi:molecular chaperone HtpG